MLPRKYYAVLLVLARDTPWWKYIRANVYNYDKIHRFHTHFSPRFKLSPLHKLVFITQPLSEQRGTQEQRRLHDRIKER